MPKIEELKKEIEKIKRDNEVKERRLRNIQEGKGEMKQLGRDKKNLQRQLKKLKNPKSSAFKRNVRKGVISGGKKTFGFLERVADSFEEAEKPRRRRKAPAKRKAPTKRKARRRQNNDFDFW